MVLWLAAKDWLTSNAPYYPYGDSLGISAAILMAAFGVLLVRKCRTWRDFAVLVGVAGCGVCLCCRNSSALAWGLMPGTGILLCSFCLPLPPDPKWDGKPRFSPPGLRRALYRCSFLIGGASLFVLTGSSEVTLLSLTPAAMAVLVAAAVRVSARFLPYNRNARKVLFGIYAVCALLFILLPLVGIDALGGYSLIGTGLRTAKSSEPASALIEEDGIVSLLCRDAILIAALWCNVNWLIRCGKDHAPWLSERTREALALSSSAVAAILVQVLVSPMFPSTMLSSGMAGAWNMAISVAALAIATRALASEKESELNSTAILALSWSFSILAAAVLCVLVSFHRIALTATTTRDFDAPGWFLPMQKIPKSVIGIVNGEGWTVTCAVTDGHDILRRTFGAAVPAEPSMAGSLGARLISGWPVPRPAKEVFGEVLGSTLSAALPRQRIEELFLNYRDYKAPTPGLAAAAKYWFHRSAETLTEADVRYLLAGQTTISEPFANYRGGVRPQAFPTMPTQYDVDEFPLFVANSDYVHHDGAVNGHGRAVGTLFAGNGSVAYSMYRDQGRVMDDLGDPANGHSSFALSINDSGEAAGYSITLDGDQHAVIWDKYGAVEDLGALPRYPQSVARWINNKGQVAGFAFSLQKNGELGSMRGTLGSPSQAFIWQQGQMQALGVPPGDIGSRAYALNDCGQVAGWVLTGNNQTHAMVWEKGRMQDIGTLGGNLSVATSINNQGQVVGSAQRKDGKVVAFLWQDGVMHDLGMLPGDYRARAWAINDSGVVVGYSFGRRVDIDGVGGRPFIWDNVNGMRDLTPMYALDPVLKATFDHKSTVFSINNAGQILGLDFLPRRPRKMFLLSPRAPADAGKQTIEAESGVIQKANIQNDASASFGSVVGNMGFPGASATYSNVDGGNGGPYALDITYAVPRNSSTTLHVNGATALVVNFPRTSAWKGIGAYRSIGVPITLKAGKTNMIEFKTEAGNSGVNLDKFTLLPSSDPAR
jgi:probable HAF family extracellular repeat protein